MSWIIKTIDKLNRYLLGVVGVLLGVMSIIVFLQVFSRYILSLPLVWSEELSRYLMIYIVFLTAAIAVRKMELISVEVLSENLSKNKKRVLLVFQCLLIILFNLILFYQSLQLLPNVHSQNSPGMQMPMSIPYFSVTIGSFLMIVNASTVILEIYESRKQVRINGDNIIN